jgi:hypothetical protein
MPVTLRQQSLRHERREQNVNRNAPQRVRISPEPME